MRDRKSGKNFIRNQEEGNTAGKKSDDPGWGGDPIQELLLGKAQRTSSFNDLLGKDRD